MRVEECIARWFVALARRPGYFVGAAGRGLQM